MNTQRVIAGAVLAAGALLGVPGVSAPANAQPVLTEDERGYVGALVRAGLGEYSAAEAIILGRMVCMSPYSRVDQVVAVYENTTLGVGWNDSVAVVNAAHQHLCPIPEFT